MIFVALVLPDRLDRLVPEAFVVAPIELVLGAAVLLALPPAPRRVLGWLLGAALGLLTVLKLVDLGFSAALGRPFDPVLDIGLLGDAVRLLVASAGPPVQAGAAIGAVAMMVAVVAGVLAAVLRAAGAAVARRTAASWLVCVGTAGWLLLSSADVRLEPDLPLASDAASAMAFGRVVGIGRGLGDRARFEREASADAYADVSSDRLLTALRGKDVALVFVESYGRSAIEDPGLAPRIDGLLDDGTRRLAAAGIGARSGYLTSPTAGGGSWLAQSTLLSGVRIDNQQRYRELVAGDRLTLVGAFARAGWRTAAVAPGTTRPWPESRFFGYQRVHDEAHLGYRGPSFSWSAMPDQYTLAEFERSERAPGHRPVMAVVPLTSSHAPWTPVPPLIDWGSVGDGSAYDGMAAPALPPEAILTRDRDQVRADYVRALGYSLQTLTSYADRFGGDDLVLILVGDHQPSPVVTGDRAGHDVPVSVVAKDPAVLARIGSWGWTTGLRPADDAPVWRMEEFRDRFLAAFDDGPRPAGSHR
ncbi:sulfatase-like hydrolase/transferase [Microlunatus ginsengisoli]|uniref:Sulfatase N-terminal domain-containing protein n=1 Tax=Microlunatus ginsengisoli TaxID=363863 RepID=A0ABP7AGX3_9ACTN